MLPRSSALRDLDAEVERAFQGALEKLRRAGAIIAEVDVPAFERQAEYFKSGGFAGAESYYIHGPWLEHIGEYDPRVAKRVLLGKGFPAADYFALADLRANYIRELEALCAAHDAFVMPSVPCIAPSIADAGRSDEDYFRWNDRINRNSGLINFLDGCAVSLPCHAAGAAPVGFLVAGPAMSDRRILAVAAAVEGALARD
jgi:aspartyl-tRNA(Asn)/glutamyl-tRNA(Gln) amidotransferase subunit A